MKLFVDISRCTTVLLSIVLIIMSGCNDAAKNTPVTTEYQTLSGMVFQGQVDGAQVKVYSYLSGEKGEELAAVTSTSNGSFEFELPKKSQPLLIESSGGSYKELTNGEQIILNPDDKLYAIVDFVEDKTTFVSVTAFTTIAFGLAEYLMSSGTHVDEAIILANSRIGNLLGIDIVRDKPDDVSVPVGGAVSNTKLYGYAIAGISNLMSVVTSSNEAVSMAGLSSQVFAETALKDVRGDGKLNGLHLDNEIISFGVVNIDPHLYRNKLANNIFVFSASDTNAAGLGALDIKDMVFALNDSLDPIFDGADSVPIENNKPNIVNFSVIDKIPPPIINGLNYAVNADVTDLFGLAIVEIRVNGAPLENISVNNTNYSVFIDTLNQMNEGINTISVYAENNIGGIVEVVRTVEVKNNGIVIDLLNPEPGPIKGTLVLEANVSDSASPIAAVDVLLKPGKTTEVGNPVSIGTDNISFINGKLSTSINTLNYIPDGAFSDYTISIFAENSLGVTQEKAFDFLFDNKKPTATTDLESDFKLLHGAGCNSYLDCPGAELPHLIVDKDYTITYQIADEGSGILSSVLSFNGIEADRKMAAGQFQYTFKTLSRVEGAYNLNIDVTDSARNLYRLSDTIVYDAAKPSITESSVIPQMGAFASNPTLRIKANDSAGLKSIEFIGNTLPAQFASPANNTAYDTIVVLDSVADGNTAAVDVVVTDINNRKSTVQKSFLVDKSGPVISPGYFGNPGDSLSPQYVISIACSRVVATGWTDDYQLTFHVQDTNSGIWRFTGKCLDCPVATATYPDPDMRKIASDPQSVTVGITIYSAPNPQGDAGTQRRIWEFMLENPAGGKYVQVAQTQYNPPRNKNPKCWTNPPSAIPPPAPVQPTTVLQINQQP